MLKLRVGVGFGDLHSYNDRERVFSIFLEALGGLLYAMLVASVTSLITSSDSNKIAIAEQHYVR
jgi:hypothetical protein